MTWNGGATEAAELSERDLIAAYLASANEAGIGVNYWLAQEAESRGLRDRRTMELLVSCEWFLLCENAADTTEPHPVLGPVPICNRCAAKVQALR